VGPATGAPATRRKALPARSRSQGSLFTAIQETSTRRRVSYYPIPAENRSMRSLASRCRRTLASRSSASGPSPSSNLATETGPSLRCATYSGRALCPCGRNQCEVSTKSNRRSMHSSRRRKSSNSDRPE
jgi:hypothetical protein